MFDAFLEPIADAYDVLPLPTDMSADDLNELRGFWYALGDDCQARAQRIQRELHVMVSDDDETYACADDMVADVRRHGRFVVSRANSGHPLWSVGENIAFRIVHDVCGHVAASRRGDVAGFDWAGENRACGAHFPLLTPMARVALFTECIAQTGFAIARGGFGPQKVGVIRPNVEPGHPLIGEIARTYGFSEFAFRQGNAF